MNAKSETSVEGRAVIVYRRSYLLANGGDVMRKYHTVALTTDSSLALKFSTPGEAQEFIGTYADKGYGFAASDCAIREAA